MLVDYKIDFEENQYSNYVNFMLDSDYEFINLDFNSTFKNSSFGTIAPSADAVIVDVDEATEIIFYHIFGFEDWFLLE